MGAEVRWIKVTTDIFEDPKVKLMATMPEGKTLVLLWVKLLVEAGKCNSGGWIGLDADTPYTPAELATVLGETQQVVEMAIRLFSERYRMIHVEQDGMIYVENWEKHQNVDGMSKIREQNRLRKQKQRQKERLRLQEPESHVTFTGRHAIEREKEEEENKNKNISLKDVSDSLNEYNVKVRGIYDLEKVTSFVGVLPTPMILDAIKRSENRGAPYVVAILDEWVQKGYRTMDDIPKGRSDGKSRRDAETRRLDASGETSPRKSQVGRIPFRPRT